MRKLALILFAVLVAVMFMFSSSSAGAQIVINVAYDATLIDEYGQDAVEEVLVATAEAVDAIYATTPLRFQWKVGNSLTFGPFLEEPTIGDIARQFAVEHVDCRSVAVLFTNMPSFEGVAVEGVFPPVVEDCPKAVSAMNLPVLLEGRTSVERFARLLAHEMGHGFGLAHTDGECYPNGWGSIMSAGCGLRRGEFSKRSLDFFHEHLQYFMEMFAGVSCVLVETQDFSPCVEDATTLCLTDDRFEVTASFVTNVEPDGVGMSQPLTNDTGYFWFFDMDNVEVVVKVLDACVVNNRFWLFAGGLTNVEVEMVVRDTETGLAQVCVNPPQTPFQPIQNTNAFATCP